MTHAPHYETRWAADAEDLRAAQRLRYDVFVAELGGGGAGVDHAARLETDRYDAVARHLLLIDRAAPGAPVIGAYRLLDGAAAERAGGFYSAGEYDLAPLLGAGRRVLELGRSCLHRDYRGGPGMMLLWQALGEHVQQAGVEILFGTASFHGTDPGRYVHALSNLHHRHRAPAALRPRAREAVAMDLLPAEAVDRRRAVLETPALIKAYLRLGGAVGEGVYVDRDFNTLDVMMVMEVAALDARRRAFYVGGRG
ncbi:GNAT family N-acetyltransferase [Roseivivax sp. CAU 1761]